MELENIMKSTLVSIDYEIKDNFNLNYNNFDLFISETKDILDYYKFTIYKNAKKSVYSKLKLKYDNKLEDNENEFIEGHSFEDFLNKLSNGLNLSDIDKEELLEKILLIIIGECIVLFKKFQINICETLNINQIKIISDDNNCCESCKLQSKLVIDPKEFDFKNIHPYCKTSIIPISLNNKINLSNDICDITHMPIEFNKLIDRLILKLSIHYKPWITKKEFIFVNEGKSITTSNNRIKIPTNLLSMIDLERLITKNLIKDKLLDNIDLKNWESLFNIKKDSKTNGDNCIIYSLPFITNTAQLSCEEYILENAVGYILNQEELEVIDKSAYDKIKSIFTNQIK